MIQWALFTNAVYFKTSGSVPKSLLSLWELRSHRITELSESNPILEKGGTLLLNFMKLHLFTSLWILTLYILY